MIVYFAERNKEKQALFDTLAKAAGGGQPFRLSLQAVLPFPETPERVAACLARAEHQPRGFRRWRETVRLHLQYNGARRWFARHPDAVAVAWGGLDGSQQAFLDGARDAGAPRLAAEHAPFAGRITLDPEGVGAENSVPREAAFFDHWSAADPGRSRDGDSWRAMGEALTARRGEAAQSALPESPFLFCLLQAPDDRQASLFSGWCGGTGGFLGALTEAVGHLPRGWHLRVKGDPEGREPPGPALEKLLATGRVARDNTTDSSAQMAASRGLVTLNSDKALQAFFFDKPVVTLGEAFFARPGLVTPAPSQASLNTAFADPEALHFDVFARARFMNWLDQVYYPCYDPANPDPTELAPWLALARLGHGRQDWPSAHHPIP